MRSFGFMMPILYRDDQMVAVAKPTGFLTHPSSVAPRAPSCMTMLRNSLKQRVFPVHRLDRATSGVLVFATNAGSAGSLGAAFRERVVRKRYVAIVRGHAPDAGTVSKDLAGVHAETHFRTLERVTLDWPVRPYPSARYSLVELTPLTGRHHQLRLHMRSLSHPIVGDTTHGDGAHNREFASRTGASRLMLHASSIELPHPTTGELTLISAVSDEVSEIFSTLSKARENFPT